MTLGTRKYKDSTPNLHVGDSAFEDWFQAQPFACLVGIKQTCRDSYAAGMGDPLVTSQAEAAAYKWAYGYLQDRMRSLGRQGWAEDCDSEIEHRIKSGCVPQDSRSQKMREAGFTRWPSAKSLPSDE